MKLEKPRGRTDHLVDDYSFQFRSVFLYVAGTAFSSFILSLSAEKGHFLCDR